jgi:hypothetical protein
MAALIILLGLKFTFGVSFPWWLWVLATFDLFI